MPFNNWGSKLDVELKETITLWQGISLLRNNETCHVGFPGNNITEPLQAMAGY